ncbi:shikimate kinase [Convivina praedatoris]|uniref:Shikimate kinase n=1 Tax=Convivina praedatoris TaxID=2880963 RepID=A0ABM9D1Q3_9LACO|nr:shikimate kinase [Convivina sp. LMG 32447]CAH1852082.1 Shikimate kinase [Convivina sp. LMG 32447]CAH1853890.1 Shikimate kinase [Convivina sp. LMG 32447]CAH1854199.1 Shikimate kinase [Convivina sp. LMG 32447]
MIKEPDTLMLIGFMGAGKTTVGREIARQHHSKFLDLDREIERAAGMSIAQIFKEHDEDYFRRIETQVLSQAQTFNGVVATGGGVVERAQNREILKNSPATLVYLHGNLESTISRLLAEGQRPLLQEKSTADFFQLWEARDPKYQEVANFTVETVGKTPQRIAAEIVALFSANEDELAFLALRSQIDAFDRQLFDIISKRMEVVLAVANYKKKVGMSVSQPTRMSNMRAALKVDYAQNPNISDEFIDELMTILLETAMKREDEEMQRG